MIELVQGLPGGVIGFEAVGEVHSDDYKNVLVPAVDAALADDSGDGIRIVYVLGDRFEGYSAGASLQDAKLGVDHFRQWVRIAVVSDHDWVGHFVHAFAWMVPGDCKAFSLAEQGDAIAWAAADA